MLKFILAVIGALFVGLLALWAIGWAGALLWYAFWIGLFAAAGYGVYRLFTKAERKFVGGGSNSGYIDRDVQMSWDEYDKKYLHK